MVSDHDNRSISITNVSHTKTTGRDNGYTVGEFLAIDDEEKQHRKLVRYYERSGFKVIKYVGDDFRDIPDRMIWGGCGTLMRQDIDTLLQSWTTILQKTKRTAETSV